MPSFQMLHTKAFHILSESKADAIPLSFIARFCVSILIIANNMTNEPFIIVAFAYNDGIDGIPFTLECSIEISMTLMT